MFGTINNILCVAANTIALIVGSLTITTILLASTPILLMVLAVNYIQHNQP